MSRCLFELSSQIIFSIFFNSPSVPNLSCLLPMRRILFSFPLSENEIALLGLIEKGKRIGWWLLLLSVGGEKEVAENPRPSLWAAESQFFRGHAHVFPYIFDGNFSNKNTFLGEREKSHRHGKKELSVFASMNNKTFKPATFGKVMLGRCDFFYAKERVLRPGFIASFSTKRTTGRFQ